jgi:CRP/FNR family cyclic AMP-dependent transcriptional regulator
LGRRDRFRSSLKQIPMFASCTKAELEQITRLADTVDVREGERLTREGASAGEFMVIVEGEATVTQRGETIRRLGPGDWLGEIALLDRGPRTATVVADTPMVIEVISRQAFLDLLRTVPTIAIKIATGLAQMVRHQDVADPAAGGPAPAVAAPSASKS